MAWFVQALEVKGADGKGAGIWHLTANSDEGGGFYVGCDHDHHSAEEAEECEPAQVLIGRVTGFPHKTKAERAAELRIVGVSRNAENAQTLMLSLNREATDDELRTLHDRLRSRSD